jgi:hypothetical protein
MVTNGLTWLDLALMPVAITCFLLVFPLFASGLISYLGRAPRAVGKAWAVGSQGTEIWNRILGGLSRSQRTAAEVFLAYVFINFFGTLALMSARHQEQTGPALQVRLMTGHAAIFLLVSAGLFRAARRLPKA